MSSPSKDKIYSNSIKLNLKISFYFTEKKDYKFQNSQTTKISPWFNIKIKELELYFLFIWQIFHSHFFYLLFIWTLCELAPGYLDSLGGGGQTDPPLLFMKCPDPYHSEYGKITHFSQKNANLRFFNLNFMLISHSSSSNKIFLQKANIKFVIIWYFSHYFYCKKNMFTYQ